MMCVCHRVTSRALQKRPQERAFLNVWVPMSSCGSTGPGRHEQVENTVPMGTGSCEQFKMLLSAPTGTHQCLSVPTQCLPVKRGDSPLLHDENERTPIRGRVKRSNPPSWQGGPLSPQSDHPPPATHFCPPTQMRLIFSPRKSQ